MDYLIKNHKFSKELSSGEKTPKVQWLKLFLYKIEVLILHIFIRMISKKANAGIILISTNICLNVGKILVFVRGSSPKSPLYTEVNLKIPEGSTLYAVAARLEKISKSPNGKSGSGQKLRSKT